MGAKLKKTGKTPLKVTQDCLRLVKVLPEKHAKGAASLAKQLAPRSTALTNPRSMEPGYVHMQDTIKAKRKSGDQWQVAVEKEEDYPIYVELGTINMDAQPFFRPAMASAQRAMRQEFRQTIKKARR